MSAPSTDPAPEGPGPAAPPAFVPTRPPRLWRARRWAASLNPLSLFFGPVFQRDIRVSGRRKGTYSARFIVLAIPAAIVTLVFIASAERSRPGGGVAGQIQALQEVAFGVAVAVAWCQLVSLTLIAPLLTAGTIVEERTARSLAAIAASPLTPGRVVCGLFAARMVQLAILALLPVPLILAIRTFGGLETSYILWSSAIAVSAAVAMAAVGLWGSTRASRPAAAISFAVLMLLLHWVGPPLIVLAHSALLGWREPSFAPFVVSPPVTLVMLTEGGRAPGFFGVRADEAAALNCAISLAIAFGALLAARRHLARLIATDRVDLVRQPSRRKRRTAAMPAGGAETGAAAADSPPLPVDDTATSRTISGNPVLWRELRQPLFEAPWKRWLSLACVLLTLLLLHVTTREYSSDAGTAITVMPSVAALVLLILAAATVPAGSITSEVEARTWATLLTTPLGPAQILLPKIAGAARRLWPPFLFVTLHLAVCIARGICPPGALPFTLAHFSVYALLLCTTGTFLSLCSRKSAVASTLNIALVLGAWLVAPIIVALGFEFVASGSRLDAYWYLMFLNPAFTYGAGLLGMCESHWTNWDVGNVHLSPGVFLALWAGSLAVYLTLAAAVLAYAKADFQRLATARA